MDVIVFIPETAKYYKCYLDESLQGSSEVI